MADSTILKKDLFGEIRLSSYHGDRVVVRDSAAAASGLRWLARRMLRREARALAALSDIDGIAEVVRIERDQLTRSYLDGAPMHHGKPTDPAYFKSAARLLRRIHRAGVAHNDLSKEPNFLVRDDGAPALIDFQLAWHSAGRGKLFRLAAREDLRHLLKHKRTYCPQQLTSREKTILANPGLAAVAWSKTVKPLYLFVTRTIMGWSDREGAGDRGDQP
jgi:RIO-like serine/threonine protein kinase